MSQTHTIGTHQTSISTNASDDRTFVRYWSTDVVQFDSRWITLDHGGWMTVTTKLRMNQAANQFMLGFGVHQKDYEWFVTTPNGQVIPWGSGRRVTFWRGA
jgi:hypothetical protein